MKDFYTAEELCDLIANALNPKPLQWPTPAFIRIRPFTGTRTPSPINQRPPDWPRPENDLKRARTATYVAQMEAMDASPLIHPIDPKRHIPKERVTPSALISQADALAYLQSVGLSLPVELEAVVLTDIEAKIISRKNKSPISRLGDSFSEEARRQNTTLTKYLPLETWTPAQAAMLVSGLCPDDECEEIPNMALGLDGIPASTNDRSLVNARNVLWIWRSRENPPERVKPIDFIVWCQTKGFDTGWLRSIEQPPAVTETETPEQRGARILARYNKLGGDAKRGPLAQVTREETLRGGKKITRQTIKGIIDKAQEKKNTAADIRRFTGGDLI